MSLEENALEEFLPDVVEEAERKAASRASASTEMTISLFEFDCMRYSVNKDETLICL